VTEHVLSAPAPAKINLVLEVIGRREDGYHEIDTVLQTLELADTVTLRPNRHPGISASGPFAVGTPLDASNLAWRAAEALAKRRGLTFDFEIELDKRVPAAGGLGGGASDAATVLRLLQRLWPGTTDEDLLEAAAEVGSDEPALVFGGTVRALGRGEHVTPLPPLARHGVVLFIPPDTIEHKTARMFAALDALPFDDGAVADAFAGRMPGALTGADVHNSFERVAFDLFPALAGLWEQLEQRIEEPVRLAGAGPTLFWIGPTHHAGQVAALAGGLACTTIGTATAGSLWTR
jgi:4-diphosphocytidyl-2-C-methyl-D-erythritol kinase